MRFIYIYLFFLNVEILLFESTKFFCSMKTVTVALTFYYKLILKTKTNIEEYKNQFKAVRLLL